MKTLLLAVIIFYSYATFSSEPDKDESWYLERTQAGKYFSRSGMYQGRTTEDGKVFNRNGRLIAKIDRRTGRVTDSKGQFVTKVKH